MWSPTLADLACWEHLIKARAQLGYSSQTQSSVNAHQLTSGPEMGACDDSHLKIKILWTKIGFTACWCHQAPLETFQPPPSTSTAHHSAPPLVLWNNHSLRSFVPGVFLLSSLQRNHHRVQVNSSKNFQFKHQKLFSWSYIPCLVPCHTFPKHAYMPRCHSDAGIFSV